MTGCPERSYTAGDKVLRVSNITARYKVYLETGAFCDDVSWPVGLFMPLKKL